MSRKLLLIFIFIHSAFSCTTTPKNNYSLVQDKNNEIYLIKDKILNSCKDNKNPQFMINIDINKETPFSIEGIWQENFSILKLNVIGYFGETYGSLLLDMHNLKLSSFANHKLHLKLNHFLAFIAEIGPKELRNILCGSYLFNSIEDKIYYI
ncbi:MAG: hypothetical protein K2X39_02255 [Silvanigrellaceae bacterium]|nr:hypothetical protein [Silvanigrellaceae bacterium]